MSNPENKEVSRFYSTLLLDLKATQISDDDGGTLEQIFTKWALDLLSDGGETENGRAAYDEKALGTKNQHKINGYSISENNETVDLFITIFKGNDDITRIGKEEVETAIKRITNFFTKSVYKEYANEIEEHTDIWNFAHTLGNSKELKDNLVRVNAVILTDGLYSNELADSKTISGYPVYFRLVDINYLYNITEKSHIPIEIDFAAEGFDVPCILSETQNSEYQSYLAIIPAQVLAAVYERFGSRLLEQNVRSFLQFSGKINKGIRNTILKEPYMFLAFNNGLAATAESVKISQTNKGAIISAVKDFQIVNGGQTTASIYHTLKKDKADISGIFVQLKLSVVKNREKFSEIVSRISEYANTQNKVSISDLSSNKPFHIELEKVSRNTVTPHVPGLPAQTYWFYERARGQYKNARVKDGFTKARQKTFDNKYPKLQVFNKEELAKYHNAYHEIYDGKKLVIGPHTVVKGNQKNYAQFVSYCTERDVDNIFFEDTIGKVILFRTAEKLYGIKPNSIGDMRYITVPYSISYLNYILGSKLDLFKIWKNQAISDNLRSVMYALMQQIENYIKSNAPGALYGEWAKKEECWNEIKSQVFEIDIDLIKEDCVNAKRSKLRKKISADEAIQLEVSKNTEKLYSIPYMEWMKIDEWGKATNSFSNQQFTSILNIASKVKNKGKLSDYELNSGIKILNIVIENAPEILFDIEEMAPEDKTSNQLDITIETIQKMLAWDKKHKKLKPHHFTYMQEVANGKSPLGEQAKRYAKLNIQSLKKYGFEA